MVEFEEELSRKARELAILLNQYGPWRDRYAARWLVTRYIAENNENVFGAKELMDALKQLRE